MTVKDHHRQAHRRRGVQASRVKLIHALTEAGLRTQAALAERIADLEKLDSAPKDLVNRAFRELPVDPQTLDRIATALDVDAHTLYKTSEESPTHAGHDADTSGSPAFPVTISAAALAISLAAIVFAGWLYLQNTTDVAPGSDARSGSRSEPGQIATQIPPQTPALSRGPLSLVVLPIERDPDNRITTALRDVLSADFSVATPTAIAAAQTTDPQEITEKLRVDLAIYGDIAEVGSLSGIRIYAYSGDGRAPLWTESLQSTQLERRSGEIAANIARAVRTIGSSADTNGGAVPHFPEASVQDDYLQGRHHLEQPTSELNIKRAQSRFSAALRQDPDYARAHAGLCMALLEEFWMGNEERAMNDAARTCADAQALAPDDSVVAIAHAYFLRRSGRSDEAISEYERLIDREPDNAIALEGLASSLLDNYRQSGDESKLTRAIAAAKRSAQINPDSWRPYNTLLNLQWFAGNIEGAIEAAENSIRFEETELVLVNLGTMYLCSGRIDKARSTYERAAEIAPDSYMGDEFLGQAMYFLGDFEQSALLRRKAIDSIAEGEPEIHEMWGNLGDSYRQIGDTAGAIGAYLQASRIAERDHLRGNAAIADRASRAYYYVMLRQLDRDTVSDEVYDNILAELDDISTNVTETSALRRVAQIWLVLGDTAKARKTLDQVIATCPGYGRMPDLAQLSSAE